MASGNGFRRIPSSTVLKSCTIALGATTASSYYETKVKNNETLMFAKSTDKSKHDKDKAMTQRTEKEETKLNSTGSLNFISLIHQMQKQSLEMLTSRHLPFQKNISYCEQKQSSKRPPPPDKDQIRKLLRRRQTMLRMNKESTKELLESRYNVDWSDTPLGIGAFGTVHKATSKNTEHENKVAIKKINKKFTDQESFQREMSALLDIREWGGHPNICALQEHFDLEDHYYLILDFIEGGEMFDHLMNNGAYSEADAARLVREVASALAFLHGIGVVHADLKPENLMLSTPNRGDAVVKLVDFGSAEIYKTDHTDDDDADILGPQESITLTPAYCPPESFLRKKGRRQRPKAPHDMWSLGLILYIMLTGVHPYDLTGDSPDEHVEARITTPERYKVPLSKASIYTSHLSESAIDLISKLMNRDPEKRLTAHDMLNHPWVRGETATTDIIAGSDERLNKLKNKMERKFFEDVLNWSDDDHEIRRKTSLIERSFSSFDMQKKGFVTDKDIEGSKDAHEMDANTKEEGGPSLTMSDFSNLLSQNMKSQHFGKGHIIYNEGDIGNHMYFINSGKIAVTTKDGSKAIRDQGDFFGEGALLNPRKIRSATVTSISPVHAMQIPREYFDKYVAESSKVLLTLREKDKIRKRNRAKAILRLQNTLQETHFRKGDYLFKVGEEGDFIYIVENGKVDVVVKDKNVFSVTPGNICGEHSLLTGKPRNSSAFCISEEGCIAQKMSGRDFRKLVDVSPSVKDSLEDLCHRRDFKKSVVTRLQKEFPYQNPREAFDAADKNKQSVLDVNDISNLLREMDPTYTDEEIQDVIKALDLTNSGNVNYDEFKKVFIADIRTSASI